MACGRVWRGARTRCSERRQQPLHALVCAALVHARRLEDAAHVLLEARSHALRAGQLRAGRLSRERWAAQAATQQRCRCACGASPPDPSTPGPTPTLSRVPCSVCLSAAISASLASSTACEEREDREWVRVSPVRACGTPAPRRPPAACHPLQHATASSQQCWPPPQRTATRARSTALRPPCGAGAASLRAPAAPRLCARPRPAPGPPGRRTGRRRRPWLAAGRWLVFESSASRARARPCWLQLTPNWGL